MPNVVSVYLLFSLFCYSFKTPFSTHCSESQPSWKPLKEEQTEKRKGCQVPEASHNLKKKNIVTTFIDYPSVSKRQTAVLLGGWESYPPTAAGLASNSKHKIEWYYFPAKQGSKSIK
jgi:hypothetical protein